MHTFAVFRISKVTMIMLFILYISKWCVDWTINVLKLNWIGFESVGQWCKYHRYIIYCRYLWQIPRNWEMVIVSVDPILPFPIVPLSESPEMTSSISSSSNFTSSSFVDHHLAGSRTSSRRSSTFISYSSSSSASSPPMTADQSIQV